MYKIYLFDYKNSLSNGKLYAIKAIKDYLNLGLLEAKNWIESLPITLDNQTEEDVTFYKEHFNCDEIETQTSNQNMREPCEATKEALAWLETLSEKEQEMIKLIGDWEHPVGWNAPVC